MKIELTEKTCITIARKVADILKEDATVTPDGYVTTREAAGMLGVSTDRMRHLKDNYPHIKVGESGQARLMFHRASIMKKMGRSM